MIFVDTWAWIALAMEDDPYHAVAQAEHQRLRRAHRKYVTSEFVLGELITYLYRNHAAAEAQPFIRAVLEAADQGIHQLVHVSSQQVRRAWDLRQKYDDKPKISFVDFTSMVVMQDLGLTEIFTGDAHFRQVGLGFTLVP